MPWMYLKTNTRWAFEILWGRWFTEISLHRLTGNSSTTWVRRRVFGKKIYYECPFHWNKNLKRYVHKDQPVPSLTEAEEVREEMKSPSKRVKLTIINP